MGSKEAILILGLLAMVVLISSEVAAKASSEKAEVVKEANEVGDAKYGGGNGHGYNGGGYPGYHGGGYPPRYGGGYPPRYGGGGGYCRYGCCGGYYGGHCRRCCSYAGEAVQAHTEAKPHN